MGNSEQVIVHMATCWLTQCIYVALGIVFFYDCYEITLVTVGEGPHFSAIVEQTMDFDQTKCAMFFQGHNNEFIMI